MRKSNKLTARQVAAAKPGRHGDGAGLYLVVAPSGARKWIMRFTWAGKPNEMALVARLSRSRMHGIKLPKPVSLSPRASIQSRHAGKPVTKHPEGKRSANARTSFLMPKVPNGATKSAQWKMTLTEYAKPLRGLPVDEVDTEAVLFVLQPMWQSIPETASRLRARIEAVLDAARAKGHIPRNEANPARWRGHLDKLLPKRQKLMRGHHAALRTFPPSSASFASGMQWQRRPWSS